MGVICVVLGECLLFVLGGFEYGVEIFLLFCCGG